MNGDEWNCASTSNRGTFIKSNDCTISGGNHVEVSGTLQIEGSRADMKHLITITAARKHRHFYSKNNPSAKLTLRYLKLVGGLVWDNGANGGNEGGSILFTSASNVPDVQLNLY